MKCASLVFLFNLVLFLVCLSLNFLLILTFIFHCFVFLITYSLKISGCFCCCSCPVTKSCLTLCGPSTTALQASLSFTISLSLLKLMSIESVMPSKHPILCCPLLLLPSIFPSIRVFSSKSALRIRWSKYGSFSFSTSPSNEYSVLISFKIDWLHPSVQGTLESLLQHHSINSLLLSLLCGPTLTCIHDYWKNCSFH